MSGTGPGRSEDAQPDYDVIVLGAGLAGLCLAIEIKQKTPSLRVLILERGEARRPEAAHKVGESSVEVASHYFRNVLGVGDLLEKEVKKFGLRFFMTEGENRDIARRLECGPKNFLTMPSDQIDRGQFENGLAERAAELGVELDYETEVLEIELAPSAPEAAPEAETNDGLSASRGASTRFHRVVQRSVGGENGAAQTFDLSCHWVVDASGRKSILKKKLGLQRKSKHSLNAAWFRVDHPIDVDRWSEDSAWLARLDAPRRLSTNHLMGEGYWVWFIPLAHDRTSVGIVADPEFHPFTRIHTYDKAMRWLEEYEPQAAEVVAAHSESRMDFLAIQNYALDAKRVFSADRWALTGDAGIFVDPLYSPGSDFIGMSNGFIADLVRRDLDGESIDALAGAYDQAFRSLARTYLFTYQRQYALMGDGRVMITKVIWDFTMYWGGVAKLFCGDRMCDPAFMERARPLLQGFAFTNLSMQALLRDWARALKGEAPIRETFVDYAGLEFLANLNSALGDQVEDDVLIAQMEENLELARSLKLEIIAEAGRSDPGFGKDADAPRTRYLEEMYDTMRAGRGASAA